MKQNGRSTNSYFIFILLLGLLIVGLNFFGTRSEDYTKAAFMADLAAENVTEVYISPNGEGLTGYLQAQLKNGSSKTLYATNIEELEDVVESHGLAPVVKDIPRESWFLNTMLPTLKKKIAGRTKHALKKKVKKLRRTLF